jgi:CRISPR-associated protein Csm2
MPRLDTNGKVLPLRDWGKNYGTELEDLGNVTAERLIEIADEVGKYLCVGEYLNRGKYIDKVNLKMNQIRRFLDGVRRIESDLKGKEFEDVKDSIILLRPKLAYAAGREEKVKPLMNVLDPAIKSGYCSINNFKKLMRLIESIIAYHTYYGGKN